MRMLTAFAVAIAVVLCVSATMAIAGDAPAEQWSAWVAGLTTSKEKMLAGIERRDTSFRPLCRTIGNLARSVCEAGYDMADARDRATIAEIDYWMAATKTTDPDALARLVAVVPWSEFKTDNDLTIARSNNIDAIFGIVPKSTTPDKR